MKYVDLWMFIDICAVFLNAISFLYLRKKIILTQLVTGEARW